MEEIGKIYGVSKMAVSKRLKKLYEKVEELCHRTGPLNFFLFLVYKSPASVLISEGQSFRLSKTQLDGHRPDRS